MGEERCSDITSEGHQTTIICRLLNMLSSMA